MTDSTEHNSTGDLAAEAVDRLRDFASVALLHDTADNHWRESSIRRACAHWKDQCNVSQAVSRLLEHAEKHHRALSLRASINDWRSNVIVSIASNHPRRLIQPTQVHDNRLTRRCFRAWVSYCLTRASKTAEFNLADQLYRSVLIRHAFHVWLEERVESVKQNELDRKATEFEQAQIKRTAFACWFEELKYWKYEFNQKQIDKLQHNTGQTLDHDARCSVHSTLLSLQGQRCAVIFYFRRWCAVSIGRANGRLQLESELHRLQCRRLLSEAMRDWSLLVKYRLQSSKALNEVEWALRSLLKFQLVRKWKQLAASRNNSQQNESRSSQHHSRRLLSSHFDAWAIVVLDRKADAHFIHQALEDAVRQWRGLVQNSLTEERALVFRRVSLLRWAWATLRSAWELTSDSHNMYVQGVAYHSTASQRVAVEFWHGYASRKPQQWRDLSSASDFYRIKQIALALHILKDHAVMQLKAHRLHAQIAGGRRQRGLESLSEHAVQCRQRWQETLCGRRHRYFALAGCAFSVWKAEADNSRYREDMYYRRVAAPIIREAQRVLLVRWHTAYQSLVAERDSESGAVSQWRKQLLLASFGQWKHAHQIRTLVRAEDNIALMHWCNKSVSRTVAQWLLNIERVRVHRTVHQRAVAEYCTDLANASQRRWLTDWRERARLTLIERRMFEKASRHYQLSALSKAVSSWHQFTSVRTAACRALITANECYQYGLVQEAYRRWSNLFKMHMHLVRSHVVALKHRQSLLLRQCWHAWLSFHQAQHAQRARENEMRELRVHHLRVQGVRQWISTALRLGWERRPPARLRKPRSSISVLVWVYRISRHWRGTSRNRSRRDLREFQQPLLTPLQITQLRVQLQLLYAEARRMPVSSRVVSMDSGVSASHSSQASLLASSMRTLSAEPDNRHSAPLLSQGKHRVEPRFPAHIFVPSASSASSSSEGSLHEEGQIGTLHSAIPNVRKPMHQTQQNVFQTPDLHAVEARLHELAEIKSTYRRARQELNDLQRPDGTNGVQPPGHNNYRDQLITWCMQNEQQLPAVQEEIRRWNEWLRTMSAGSKDGS